MANTQSFKKWWKRLLAPTSEDFKWLRARAVAIGSTAMAIIGLKEVGVEIPHVLATICNYIVILAVGVAGTASFTRQPLEEKYVEKEQEKPTSGTGTEQTPQV